MQEWLRTWWRETWRAPLVQRIYVFGTILSLLLGVFLRLNSYLGPTISLWYDEALWGSRTLSRPLLDFGIRPIGFVWLSRTIVQTFGVSELSFRFLLNLSAIVSLLLTPYVARRLFENKLVRLLLVLLFAIHPALVDLANEYKPYTFEVLLHLVPIVLYLRLQQTQQRGYFYALLLFLPISFVFAYNMAFAFPGVLLLCLAHAWSSPQRRTLVAATLLSGALCAGTALTIYRLALSNVVKEDSTENYWGKKYDVFHHKGLDQSRVDWTFEKYNDLVAIIGLRRDRWPERGQISEKAAAELGSVERLFWVGLNLAGLLALWRKQRKLLLLLAAPILVMAAVNVFGKWPMGAFRTNVFAVAYVFPVPLIGMEALAALGLTAQRILGVLVLGLSIVPGFLFGFDWHGNKRTFTRNHYQREVLQRLYDLRKEQLAGDPTRPPARLMMDAHTYHPHAFYMNDYAPTRARFRSFFKQNFVQDNMTRGTLGPKIQQRLAKETQPLWVVVSKNAFMPSVDSYVTKNTKVLHRENLRGEHLILLLEKR